MRNPYAWFRLLVQAVGLLLAGLSLEHVIAIVYFVVRWGADSEFAASYSGQSLGWTLLGYIGVLAQFAFGLYLVFGGKWIIRQCMLRSGLCHACGYDLQGSSGEVCPECGVRLLSPPVDEEPPPPPQASKGTGS